MTCAAAVGVDRFEDSIQSGEGENQGDRGWFGERRKVEKFLKTEIRGCSVRDEGGDSQAHTTVTVYWRVRPVRGRAI